MSFASARSTFFSSSIVQRLEHFLATDGKTIGLFGSVCLIANNITGPAMVGLGTAYAQAGYIPTTALILLCGMLSLLSSGFLCETIYGSVRNRGFTRRMEVLK
jgi:amino acid permease